MSDLVNVMFERWSSVLPWLLFLVALIGAIQKAYSAERDRRALMQVELQRHKLELEVHALQNNPKLISERRTIYDQVRDIVNTIVASGNASNQQIHDLHACQHDAMFRYPNEITEKLESLMAMTVDLHRLNKLTEGGRDKRAPEEWKKIVDRESQAFSGVSTFLQEMPNLFRPYISL